MFRRTSSILGAETDLDVAVAEKLAALDADVIMTAMVLGFSAGQLAKGNPMEFHAPKGSWDEEQLVLAVKRINVALGDTWRQGGEVKAGRTPEWEVGAMITGARDGEKLPFEKRHGELTNKTVRLAHAIASRDTNVGYQGWGAYTGFVDDPVRKRAGITSTIRVNVAEGWPGSRWLPPRYRYLDKDSEKGDQSTLPWGLITGAPTLQGGMVQHPFKEGSGLVGYTHGMIQAIYDSVATGPWCAPYEIAVGEYTTKLASCLPCSLFMYAAGYPPTAIHLGRGESWIPFYPKGPKEDGYSVKVDEAIRTVNGRWYLQCGQHLALGVKILIDNGALAKDHQERFALLGKLLSERSEDETFAANLMLDAITVHGHEVERINRTLSID